MAFSGDPQLVDYISTKEAIVSLTRGLALQLVQKGIRVNGRLGLFTHQSDQQPWARAICPSSGKIPRWVGRLSLTKLDRRLCFLHRMTSYFTDQFLHPNGGMILNG
ncbi:hypothetical protein L1987_85728 [Smallanthus sonchifolius]|uniref:Uncharacterized protein n=1 Tax=Smallanthus sonchifolius TaxID=185202 RepID=A0ACB8XY24_9ASTR|nr:hypothetical protein L1987_85728 [Smallanthus sonchifolius]